MSPEQIIVESIVGAAMVAVVAMFLRFLRAQGEGQRDHLDRLQDTQQHMTGRAVDAIQHNTEATTRLSERLSLDQDEQRRQTRILSELTDLHRRDDTSFANRPILDRLDRLETSISDRLTAAAESKGVQTGQEKGEDNAHTSEAENVRDGGKS